jgi:hypothetical protein
MYLVKCHMHQVSELHQSYTKVHTPAFYRKAEASLQQDLYRCGIWIKGLGSTNKTYCLKTEVCLFQMRKNILKCNFKGWRIFANRQVCFRPPSQFLQFTV